MSKRGFHHQQLSLKPLKCHQSETLRIRGLVLEPLHPKSPWKLDFWEWFHFDKCPQKYGITFNFYVWFTNKYIRSRLKKLFPRCPTCPIVISSSTIILRHALLYTLHLDVFSESIFPWMVGWKKYYHSKPFLSFFHWIYDIIGKDKDGLGVDSYTLNPKKINRVIYKII